MGLRFRRTKMVTLDIDKCWYWCPKCKEYQRFKNDGRTNSRMMICEKGYKIRRISIESDMANHPSISCT